MIENENKKDGEYFTATLYQMDLDRIRYSLKQYFRIRILKIEDSVEYILSNIVVMDRLSDHEKLFLSKISNLNNYFKEDLILNRVNDEIRELFENSTDVVKHCQPEMNVRYKITVLYLNFHLFIYIFYTVSISSFLLLCNKNSLPRMLI